MPVFELKEKHVKALESYHAQIGIEDAKESRLSRRSSSTSVRSVLPDWMTKVQITIMIIVVVLGLAGTVFWGVFPFLKVPERTKQTSERVDERTGFRTICIIIHSLINAAILLTPFFIWYFHKFKIHGFSQKDLPFSERSLYYSYSINEGMKCTQHACKNHFHLYTGAGQQVASLGIATSNIIYALLILFRFEYFKWIALHYTKEINKSAAFLCLFIGLFVRVFASLIPSLPVHTHKVMHYMAAGMYFISMGIYMLVETLCIDETFYNLFDGYHEKIIFRRTLCCMYWFAFTLTCAFMKLKMWGFSSIGELAALLCAELYLLTYLTSFRQLDAHTRYLSFPDTPEF